MAKAQRKVTEYYKRSKRSKNTNSVLVNTARAIGRIASQKISQGFKNRYKRNLKYRYNSPHYKNPVANGYGKTVNTYTKRVKDPMVPKLYKYMSSLTTYKSLDTGAAVSTVGQQGVQMIGTWYAGRSGVSTPGDSALLLQNQFNDAQNYLTGATTTFHTGNTYISGNAQQSYKLYLQNFIHEITLTNQSQVDSKLTLYYCFSKCSAADSDNPITVWTNGLNAERNLGAANGPNFVGSKPTDTKTWNLRWKLFHKENLIMPAGYTHEHKQKVNFDRLIDMLYADTFNIVRGITICCFAVWSGQPVDDGTNAKVAFAPIKLIWTSNYTANCRFVVHNNKSVRQVDNQETGLTALKFVDDMAGVVGDLLTSDPNA